VSLLATAYANDKALVTTGLTKYNKKAKQKDNTAKAILWLCLIFSISRQAFFGLYNIPRPPNKNRVSITLKAKYATD
jgi:hypothetical protein